MVRNTVLLLTLLCTLTQCEDANSEIASSELLSGVWKHANNTNTIALDQNGNFVVSFGADIIDSLSYQLNPEESSDTMLIYDSLVMYECAFQFLGQDQLALTLVNVADISGLGKSTSVYYRAR